LREHFRDTREQLEHSLCSAHKISDLISEINDRYQLLLQDRTNRRLRMLTILSAVFMPATLLAGIYGMNFERMPELRSPYGYFITLGAMVGFTLVALTYFFKAGWFSSDS
jgi:magnesium transporter